MCYDTQRLGLARSVDGTRVSEQRMCGGRWVEKDV
jgi:hypothetical protein